MRDVVGVVVVSSVMRLLGVFGTDILPSASSDPFHPRFSRSLLPSTTPTHLRDVTLHPGQSAQQ